MEKTEIVELNGKKYELVLNRESFVRIDRICNINETMRMGSKPSYELLDNINECEEYCKGASRAGANGARAKLEYIKDAVKMGTKVIIASAKYSIKDLLQGDAPATRIYVK